MQEVQKYTSNYFQRLVQKCDSILSLSVSHIALGGKIHKTRLQEELSIVNLTTLG